MRARLAFLAVGIMLLTSACESSGNTEKDDRLPPYSVLQFRRQETLRPGTIALRPKGLEPAISAKEAVAAGNPGSKYAVAMFAKYKNRHAHEQLPAWILTYQDACLHYPVGGPVGEDLPRCDERGEWVAVINANTGRFVMGYAPDLQGE